MYIIHITSPILYIGFVKLLQQYPSCEDCKYMKNIRQCHNIMMSSLSGFMLLMITIGNYQTGKFESINDLLCSPYGNNISTHIGATVFLWSKYLEWIDTLFLHISKKPITMLHYTHHMSTAFLMYMNYYDYLSPHMYIFMGSNCFVHIWMYWYFAFPNGWLYPYRRYITQIQIVQHIVCLTTIVHTYALGSERCEQNKYGNFYGGLMYLMYLCFFAKFYIGKYLIKYKN